MQDRSLQDPSDNAGSPAEEDGDVSQRVLLRDSSIRACREVLTAQVNTVARHGTSSPSVNGVRLATICPYRE